MSKRSKKDKKKKRSTAERAKHRAETHKTGFENTAFEVPEDVKTFAIKSDKAVRLDIIPYRVGEGNPYADEGELHYERTFFVHRGVGVDQTSYVCLRKTNEESCPICEYRTKLMKDPDADEDLIRDLAPKERQLFNVIDTKDKNKGVQVWEMSFHLFGKKLDYEIKNSDEDDGYENFAELEGGFTLKCGIEERSFSGRSFFEVVSINFKSREDDYDEDILEKTTCLDEILTIRDYDELKEIFLQTTEEDEDEEKPSKAKKSKKKKKKPEPKDEDEEEDENEDEDWDEDNGDDNDTDEDEDDTDEPAFEKGDRVSAEIDDETYEGIIKKVKDDEATVLFDDGDKQTIDFNNLTRLENDEDDFEDEDEDKNEKKKSKSKKSKKSGKSKGKGKDKKKSKKNKCPGGGTFGKDEGELPECDDCPVWDECDDA